MSMNPRLGFSIIEVLAATVMVATLTGGVLAVVTGVTRATAMAERRVVAAQLAREGIEAARQIRDHNITLDAACARSDNACASWDAGILGPDQSSQFRVVTETDFGFLLSEPANEGGCLMAAAIELNRVIYCRRLFVELTAPSSGRVRVRSQVVWLGDNRNVFQWPQATCRPDNQATEWCLENTGILTDWAAP